MQCNAKQCRSNAEQAKQSKVKQTSASNAMHSTVMQSKAMQAMDSNAMQCKAKQGKQSNAKQRAKQSRARKAKQKTQTLSEGRTGMILASEATAKIPLTLYTAWIFATIAAMRSRAL